MKISNLRLVVLTLLVLNIGAADFQSTFASPSGGGVSISIRKFQAWTRFRDGDYKDALVRYKELNTVQPNSAFYNMMIGKCHLALENYEDAIKYFETAQRIDPRVSKDLPFQAGLAYQKMGDMDNALKNYNNYVSSLSPVLLRRDVLIMDYINSCLLAKEMMASPVNAKVIKLGSNVNSDYDDASPGLTPDGKTLVFTSRRVADGIEKLNADVNPYNDKMYISKWDAAKNTWDVAQPAGEEINYQGHIGSLSLSHDGKTMFIFKNIPDETNSGDIFFAELQADGKWTKPIGIGKPVNSSYFESSACLAPDNNVLYFVSERKGGFGSADIFRSHRLTANKWSTPENLKGVINSEYDELGVYMHPDGKTLYFSSNGHDNMGGYDIFMSTLEDGVWSQPKNMGYPINSTFDEKHFILSADGKTAYLSSNRDGVYDIYQVDMSNYASKEPVKVVTQYITESGQMPSAAVNAGDKPAKKKAETEVSVYNDYNDEKVATFNPANTGDFVLKLKPNETYTISVINKDEQKIVASVKTNESGEYNLKISPEEEILVSIEKNWKNAVLRIKMINK